MDFNKKTQLPSFGGMDLGYGFSSALYGFQKKISEIYVNQLRADSFAHSRITCKTNPAIYISINFIIVSINVLTNLDRFKDT